MKKRRKEEEEHPITAREQEALEAEERCALLEAGSEGRTTEEEKRVEGAGPDGVTPAHLDVLAPLGKGKKITTFRYSKLTRTEAQGSAERWAAHRKNRRLPQDHTQFVQVRRGRRLTPKEMVAALRERQAAKLTGAGK